MARLANLVRFITPTEGVGGPLTIGTAVEGFISPSQAGMLDGETYTYAIEDGPNREIGRGTYLAAGPTISRTVLNSTNSNNPINLSGSAQVVITPAAEDVDLTIGATITVNIPTDFDTLQDAIDFYSSRPVAQGARIVLMIESGHSLLNGIVVNDGDYGRFWIESVDAQAPLDLAWSDGEDFILGVNARLPVLNCVINGNNRGRVGIWANNASSVYVPPGKGIVNWGNGSSGVNDAGQALRIAHGSTASLGETVFSGAGTNTLRATNGALVFCSGADFSSSGAMALMISRGCVVSCHDANLSGAAQVAVRCARSIAHVRASDCRNAGEYGIWAFEGANVMARNADCSGAGIDGVHCFQGGATVDISGGTISNCAGRGLYATDGSKINAAGATINGNGTTAIGANNGSEVNCAGATISGNIGRAMWVTDGARVNASEAIIDAAGSAESHTCEISMGAYACLRGASIANSPGRGAFFHLGATGTLRGGSVTGSGELDIILETGSIVSAHGCATTQSATSGNSPDLADVSFTEFNILNSRGILFA